MAQVKIRRAGQKDAPALQAIYAPYVRDTAISFEYEAPSPEEFEQRIEQIGKEYPFLVFEAGGRPLAYAYAHRHMERAAYRWNAELSVYVHPGALRRGIGRALYGALLELLECQGVQTVYALVTWPNENSGRLHEAMGFRRLCVMERMGYKQGKWRDVAWFAKELGGHEDSPAPFWPFSALEPGRVEDILRRRTERVQAAWNDRDLLTGGYESDGT